MLLLAGHSVLLGGTWNALCAQQKTLFGRNRECRADERWRGVSDTVKLADTRRIRERHAKLSVDVE